MRETIECSVYTGTFGEKEETRLVLTPCKPGLFLAHRAMCCGPGKLIQTCFLP